jgi:hypothetical protein
VHVLVAASGGAVSRFDALAAAAGTADAWREVTTPGARVRVGIVGGNVVAANARDGRAVAVLGSDVFASGPAIAGLVLDRFSHAPHAMLDGLGDDLVAVGADEAAGTLTLAAGVGNHRLFTADVDGGVLVASHLAPLAAALGGDLAVDRSYEDFLLGFGFLPDGRTVYADVRVLGAGAVRVVPGDEQGRVQGVSEPLDVDVTDRTAVRKALHEAFLSALEEQAGTRRRHAVLLGGFDSALVAAGLRRLGHDVDCYTFGFDDPAYEQRNAELTASSIGAQHQWVRFTPAVVGDLLGRFDELINQPGAQPHYQLHTVHASNVIAADGHSHIFNGDGCDAVFLGYPTVNQRARLVARLGSVPAPVHHAVFGVLARPAVERWLGHVARLGRSFLGSLDLSPGARGHLATRYLDDISLRRLRRGVAPAQAEPVDATRERLAKAVAGLDRTRLAFHGNALTAQSKAKVEGSVAVSGIAQFSPFLHPRLKSLAAGLPADLLRTPGSKASAPGKAVLVEMAREHALVPETVIAMPKQSPSDSPIDRWYMGPLRELIDELLAGLPFEYDRAWVNEVLTPKWAEEQFRRRVSLSHHAYQAIGLLCSYAAFTRRAR